MRLEVVKFAYKKTKEHCMNIENLELKDLSKKELLEVREDLILDLNQYDYLQSQGNEVDCEIIFQTNSALLAIDELLETSY